MRLCSISLFFVLTAATGDITNHSVFNYHRKIGITRARKLKILEERIVLSENGKRIVGGSSALITLVPYQAGLVITVDETSLSVCGGSLLSDSAVLTAAHCYHDGVSKADSITVVLGSNFIFTGGTRVQSQNTIVHSGFNPITAANDIALMRIQAVTFSESIQPIHLPSGSEITKDFNGWMAVASGYGRTTNDEQIGILQMLSSVTVQVMSNKDCQDVYGDLIQHSVICTNGLGGVGTCAGDSGGPLAVSSNGRKILIGVTSFGAESCEAWFPSAYTRVTEHLLWISVLMN